MHRLSQVDFILKGPRRAFKEACVKVGGGERLSGMRKRPSLQLLPSLWVGSDPEAPPIVCPKSSKSSLQAEETVPSPPLPPPPTSPRAAVSLPSGERREAERRVTPKVILP